MQDYQEELAQSGSAVCNVTHECDNHTLAVLAADIEELCALRSIRHGEWVQ